MTNEPMAYLPGAQVELIGYVDGALAPQVGEIGTVKLLHRDFVRADFDIVSSKGQKLTVQVNVKRSEAPKFLKQLKPGKDNSQ